MMYPGAHTVDQSDPVTQLEADWRLWRLTLFPSYLTDALGRIVPDGPHHLRFWEWVWQIRKGHRAPAFVGIWPRGGGKSTNVEMATVALGALQTRRYGWYTCATQDQADDHVASIGSMLESPEVGAFYPALSARRVGKYGHSRGWRGNRLTTAAGFTVDAVGLDKAIRGRRMIEDRPDLIILDDVDDALDGPAVTRNKITAITKKILPAGSEDLVVVAIQNLVHADSFFTRMTDGRADYLTDRILSGPIPAVDGLEVEQRIDPETGDPLWYITAGEATWIGFDLETAQAKMHEEGLTAFASERQHNVEPPAGGMFDHIDFKAILVEWDALPELDRVVVWVDPAVTSTDESDAFGIQADALGADGRIYRLYSWEQRTTPEDALERAVLKAIELGADHVGIETDQGGDTWASVYREAVRNLETHRLIRKGEAPRMASDKASRQRTGDRPGAGVPSKAGRATKMLADYDRGRIRHVRGTHTTLERALRRFPRTKPFDLVDTAYWSWADLRHIGEIAGATHNPEIDHRHADTDDPYTAPRPSTWRG